MTARQVDFCTNLPNLKVSIEVLTGFNHKWRWPFGHKDGDQMIISVKERMCLPGFKEKVWQLFFLWGKFTFVPRIKNQGVMNQPTTQVEATFCTTQ